MSEVKIETNGDRKERYDFEHSSSDEIQRELDFTRREMANTIRAIEHELSSGQLMMRAMQMFRAGPGRFTENLGRAIVDNPVPIALIGVGVLWLSKAEPRTEEGAPLKEKAAELAGNLHGIKERAQEVASRSTERVRHSAKTVRRAWHENPMLIGLCALGGGAFLAAVLPTTQRERELVGPHRDRLLEQTKETAHAIADDLLAKNEETRKESVRVEAKLEGEMITEPTARE